MSAGTEYQTKQELLDAVAGLVYTNTNNEVSADDEQTAMNHMIETLWPKLGGAAPINIAYGDLINLVNSGGLIAGQKYTFTYQCKHYIPNTVTPNTVLNIDSPQYISKTETLEAVAISTSELHAVVKSYDHIYDMIVFDFDSNFVLDDEANPTAIDRTGEIIYRKDHENNLETYYDFRGAYFRRWNLDPAASRTRDITDLDLSVGVNVSKGDTFTYNNGDELYIVLKDTTSATALSSIPTTLIDDTEKAAWLPKQDLAVIGLNPNLKGDITSQLDRLTFSGVCQDITVNNKEDMYSDDGLGYPNITFTNSNNIVLESGTFESLNFVDSSNININGSVRRSTFDNSDWDAFNNFEGLVFESSRNIYTDSSGHFLSNNNSEINSNYNLLNTIEGSIIKNGYKLSGGAVIDSIIEENCRENYFKQISQSSIGINLEFSSILALGAGTIGNDCNYLDLSLSTGAGGRGLSIGAECTNITINSITSENLTIGTGCNNITIVPNVGSVTVSDSIIDNKCNNITIRDAVVTNMQMNVNNSNITLEDATFTNLKFGNSNDTISIIPTSGDVTNIIIGQNNSSLIFTNSLIKLTVGNYNSTFTSSVILSRLIIGNYCDTLDFNTENKGGYIKDHTKNITYTTEIDPGDVFTNTIVSAGTVTILNHQDDYYDWRMPFIEADLDTTVAYLLDRNTTASFYITNTHATDPIDITVGADSFTCIAGDSYKVDLANIYVNSINKTMITNMTNITD